MVVATNLGFPRIGENRDLKKLVENYWSKKINQDDLLKGAKDIRIKHWKLQKEAGIEQGHIPSNDFSFYDQVLDHIVLFNVIPEKYSNLEDSLQTYFALGRGLQIQDKVDVPSLEMKKWFDTNYHYIVPEFGPDQKFKLNSTKPIEEFKEAKAIGITTKPVLLGPVSFLTLGKTSKANESFDPLTLLDSLLPVYVELINSLVAEGAEWIQIDEPILAFDLKSEYKGYFEKSFEALSKVKNVKYLLANYFGRYGPNLDIVSKLPIAAFHADLIRAPEEIEKVIKVAKEKKVILSLGLVNGRNIWITDLSKAVETAKKAVDVLGSENVFIAPSCSLLHSPHSLEREVKLKSEIKSWLSFAVEKLSEINTIAKAASGKESEVSKHLESNKKIIEERKSSKLIHNDEVKKEVKNIKESDFKRKSEFTARWKVQQEKLKLPLFPTTTVGSFPQTKEIRLARQKNKKGELDEKEYEKFLETETEKCVRFQEKIGLSVLVHGEFERNDMVEYFGEQLDGYVFSQNGWVQSYGSRCVKPPIIYGDVSRPTPMTVRWSQYAQTLTSKPMKGMLTGPVTMLQWSFVRDDQPRKDTAFQLALAIRKEVVDLEKAGISVIQIDEPAIREGLPLRKEDWAAYLKWAANTFKLSSSGVEDSTQIHTHMCYSDFNDIFTTIQALDADAITIENSKSDLKLLSAFEQYGYSNSIGPGLYDIHSPRVPSVEEMEERLKGCLQYIKKELIWVNPDCGLKTRGWTETEKSLENLCTVAEHLRKAN